MIWVIFLAEVILFYFFALLQNSFFTHFSLMGGMPNLVFALFFIFLFFGKRNIFYLFFLAVFAGIFLDIFLAGYFGISVVILFILGMFAKKIQTSLREGEENHSFIFFMCIFGVFYILYDILLQLPALITFGGRFFASLIINILCASLLFFLIKKFKLEKFLK